MVMQIWAVGRNDHLLLGPLFNWVFLFLTILVGDQTWISVKFLYSLQSKSMRSQSWKRTITVVSVAVVS